MKLTVIGTGYVGLVTGACFAEMGNTVTCIDKDAGKLDALAAGRIPFHEPGLSELVAANRKEGRLRFTASLPEAVAGAALHFIAVNTPAGKDGSADVTNVMAVARELGRCLVEDCVVVTKSTAPVGTAEQVRSIIGEELGRRGIKAHVEIAANPEFLKEGNAVADFMRPDRVVVGGESAHAIEQLRTLYAPFTRNHERMLVMGLRDAEMTKYAANAMLATRISYMNEIANLCERLGVDVENVNERQKLRLMTKMKQHFGSLRGKRIAVWGLAFKPKTDDMREAPAVPLIRSLLDAGADVAAYDPEAAKVARTIFGDRVDLKDKSYDALAGADALAIVTEWHEFREPDWTRIKKLLKTPVIFDGRNIYNPEQLRGLGFTYHSMGRK